MRCPKCRLITYEGRRTCPRCGEDLSSLSETLGPFYEAALPEDLILKDTLLTPPPFIGTSEMPPPPGIEPEEPAEGPEAMPGPEMEGTLVSEPSGPPETGPAPEEDELFKELEEALEEEKKGEEP